MRSGRKCVGYRAMIGQGYKDQSKYNVIMQQGNMKLLTEHLVQERKHLPRWGQQQKYHHENVHIYSYRHP